MIIVVVGVEFNRGFCCERVDCFVPPLDAMKDPVHPIPRSRGRSALFIRFSVQSTDTDDRTGAPSGGSECSEDRPARRARSA